MPDDAILGKFSTLNISTGTGPLNSYDCTVKSSEKFDKQPVKQHYLGKMNASYIPDTNCDMSGSLTVADKDGTFWAFFKTNIAKQVIGQTYPTISLTRTTKYKNGTTQQNTYRNLIFSTQGVDIEAESPQNITLDWVAEETE
jgi:hypothetical protein